MAITSLELLTLAEEGIRTGGDFSTIAREEVIPLTVDDADDIQSCLELMKVLKSYDAEGVLCRNPQVFEPLAKVTMNLIDLFCEIPGSHHNNFFKPTIEFGSGLFLAYTQRDGENHDLAHRLAVELYEFPLECQPAWLDEAIVKFHRRAFDDLSVKTLKDIALMSDVMRYGFKDDSKARDTYLFTDAGAFKARDLFSNPFLSSLMRTSMTPQERDVEKETFDVFSNTRKGLDRAAGRLVRLEGADIQLKCANIDYLLVTQLIDLFQRAYSAVEDEALRDKYVRASDVLCDLVVRPFSDPLLEKGGLYRRKPGGVAWCEGSVSELMLTRFAEATLQWPKDSPFSSSMNKVRRAFFGSTLNVVERLVGGFSEQSSVLLHQLLDKSRDDLIDPEFQEFIGKPGRLKVATMIGKLNDPELKKEFLKGCKDVRGAALENDLGL